MEEGGKEKGRQREREFLQLLAKWKFLNNIFHGNTGGQKG